MHFNGKALKLLIFNHIDHVSHYFRKIWSLHAGDMNSILKLNYHLSFKTGFSRFTMPSLVVVRIYCLPCNNVLSTPRASGFAEAPAGARPRAAHPSQRSPPARIAAGARLVTVLNAQLQWLQAIRFMAIFYGNNGERDQYDWKWAILKVYLWYASHGFAYACFCDSLQLTLITFLEYILTL